MGGMVGYILTWTTYGTWLPGDKRGYVQDGTIWEKDKALEDSNRKLRKTEAVRLTNTQKRIVENTIIEEAKRIKQEILAIRVFSNHVHIVVGSTNESIENTVSLYKNKSTSALKKTGMINRIWTRGFNKRFCFNNEELNTRIGYVNRHERD